MDFDKVGEIFEKISGLLEVGGANPEAIEQIAVELYDGFVAKYRPVIQAVPSITEKFAEDLAPIITAVFKLINVLNKDQDLLDEMKKFQENRAGDRFETLATYRKAGFTRPEAMVLVLQDAANAKIMRESLKVNTRL